MVSVHRWSWPRWIRPWSGSGSGQSALRVSTLVEVPCSPRSEELARSTPDRPLVAAAALECDMPVVVR